MSLHPVRVVQPRQLHTHKWGDDMQHVMSNGVIIVTDFAAKTEEEREEVDRAIAKAAWSAIEELIERGEAV